MTADLELFTTIRLPKLKINDQSSNQNGIVIEDDQNGCKTPNSKESKIPSVLSCPPAPKKPKRRRAASCKKKLLSEFFEIVNRDEVDAFFNAAFDDTMITKRRCPTCIL